MTDLAKGDRTRARILDEAVGLASVQGVGGLTIGPLAERLGLSKSGLFAHFRSKEALQVETLDRAAALFRASVSEPVRGEPDRAHRLAHMVPMKRVGTADEIANAIVWLMSDDASYVTSTILDVSGGR